MKKIRFAVILVLLFLVGCGNNGDEDVFEIAVIPSQSIGEMQEGLTKLEETLAQELDREVTVEPYPNYNAVVEAINYNHIDLAYLGPVTYVLAHEQSGAQAIITQLIDGEPFYHSYIVTHADAQWEDLDELLEDRADIDFAFGSMSSTSGSIIPSVELYERGVFQSPDEHDFGTLTYTGSHDITAESVQNKQVDAGAIDSAIFDALVEEGTIDGDQFNIIWESEKLYQYPWVVPGEMDEETITAIQNAFVDITDTEILSIFGGASGFITTSDEEYQAVAEAVEVARGIGLLE
ncbi:phosphate/phosphite/phosphonate ABC transporter substrate-binding protein [Desertibacillus haloalkaliphilus]|uniref:phosphate/phosphite/phosphonate ABC transporter substrate-binding protein n=1 Tax=Desertibacillus haloalkaliphilus TaxID=1328930 RepID=UPI001C27D0A5|nr:phosphate/phosphite/phosphonate ABC transporter substrate-binding protein [Desertibacillus haloalkaliphilus]MBU8907413.1 phosphate/phosphite/phosphonate ABC transporter substrate-binding protein [Desertibacillus haloalkaliphilus]